MRENKVILEKNCISLNKAKSVGKELDLDAENVIFNNDHLSIWNEEKTTPKGKSLLEKRAGKMLVKTKRKIKEYAEKDVIGILTVIIENKNIDETDDLMDHIFEWGKRTLGIFRLCDNVICIRRIVTEKQIIFEVFYIPITISGEKTYIISPKEFWSSFESRRPESWLEFTFFTDVVLAYDHIELNITDSIKSVSNTELYRLMISAHGAFQINNSKLESVKTELSDLKMDYQSTLVSLETELLECRERLQQKTEELDFYKSASESLLHLPQYIHDNKDALLKGANVIIDIVKGSD